MQLAVRFSALLLFLYSFGPTQLSAQNYFSLVNNCIDTTTVAVAFTGETEISTCGGDGTTDRIRFATGNLFMPYGYVVVDEADRIVSIGYSNFIDFEGLPNGALRVYAFSTQGGPLTARVGEDFGSATLSIPCFGLTTNFVSVFNAAPGGPDITSSTGETEFLVCPGDGIPDIVTVSAEAPGSQIVYLVTDEENVILDIDDDGSIDFDGAPVGICRIYAFAYGTEIGVSVGEDIDDLGDFGCGGPSDNYITVIRRNAEGGTVSLADGGTEILTCPGDGIADILDFTGSNFVGSNYAFVVTDTNNVILTVSTDPSINFDGAGVGDCRVWGLAYEGEITAVANENATTADLASGCFDLSDNFVEVKRRVAVGGMITTVDGDTEISVCPGDNVPDVYEFFITQATGGTVALVVTDENNVIVAAPGGTTIDFESSTFGVCRVWNVTYQGDLMVQIGDDITDTQLSTSCSDLSDNFVTVIRTSPNGGTVATDAGETELFTCPGDGLSDEYTFVNTGADGSGLLYIVTDSDGSILTFNESGTFDFEGAGEGVCRVYTLAYEGDLMVEAGQNVGEARLASACFTLSDNFVAVTRQEVDGGSVTLTGGGTEARTCPGDGVDDLLTFENSGNVGNNFTYVVTDSDNNILGIPDGNEVNFEGAGVGVCRVWGLAYEGEITAQVGDNAGEVDLASGCFDLSDAFVTVVREVAVGGSIATDGGETEIAVCPGDDNPDLVSFVVDGNGGGTSTLVVTDDNNVILAIPGGSEVDFNGSGFGICRVWNLTYQGDLTAQVGDDASAVSLASGCFALSDNFVTVVRTTPNGGTVATADGATEVVTCPGDGLADPVVVVNTGADGSNLIYVITDENNVILNTSEDGELDFEGAGVGNCRVWSLSYEGNLLAQAGDNATEVNLATGCYALSDNFVNVIRTEVEGATVATTEGETEVLTCPGDGVADVFTFSATGGSDFNFTYIVTDANGVILGVPSGNEVNFEEAGEGSCRVYGLTYMGDLTAQPDDTLSTTQLATGCFALSDNFVTVRREVPSAGQVSTTDGVTEIVTCQGDGVDDIIAFEVTGSSGGQQAFVVTDTNNIIIGLPTGNEVNFEGAGVGICRVWSVTFQGEFIAQLGDNAAEIDFSNGCYDLSANFVNVIRFVPEGGTVSTDLGETEVSVCPGDDLADLITFTNDGADATTLSYLITDENNVVLAIADGDSFDFTGAELGVCRVWSVTYDGLLLVQVGDNAAEVRLASGCYSLSDNFITVNRIEIEGGSIATDEGSTQVTSCPGDGNPDVFTFVAEGNSALNFSYVVTDENNVILGVPGGATIDFDQAGVGNCRVWGLTYAGTLLASPGNDATVDQLASGCYALTENFVTVQRIAPEGGTISTEDGETTVRTCPGDGVPDIIAVDSTGTSLSRFTYIITDENNVVLSLPFGDAFNLDGAGTGTCRIYGMGYEGVVVANIGDTLGVTPLANDCHVFTENYVTVIRERPAGGTVSTTDGAVEAFVCPSDELPDILNFQSEGASGGNFTYVVTDTNNVILGLPEGNSVDFNPAGLGVCRLWGLSYQGQLLAQVGDNAATVALADGCFALSDNFVTVYREEVNGGTVATTNGQTMVTTCPGDGNDDVISFVTTGASTGNFTYVVTDSSGAILAVPSGNSANFEEAGIGLCYVYGLTYVGQLLAQAGDTISTTALSSGCFALTDNFVTVVRTEPEGGSITSEMGDGTIDLCSGDDTPDVISLSAMGNSPGNYTYIVAQEGFVLAELPGNSFDFNNAQPGTYTIYGLSYAGSLTFIPGDTVATAMLASSCFDLSDNFITVNIERVDGCELGVQGIDGTFAYLCPQNPNDGILTFTTCSDRADTNYLYVITTPDDIIITPFEGNTFDFGALPLPQARVYAISYTGNLVPVLSGLTITEAQLSDGCFTITDNFITVVNDQPEAGTISLGAEINDPFCVANGDGTFSVETTSTSNAGYVILVTDTMNVVQQIADPDNVDFTDLPEGTYRLHGLSYTGNLTVQVGDDADLVALADNCFELTAEFITLDRGQDIDGGIISYADGSEVFYVCPQDGDPDLVLIESTVTGVPYRYLVTDDEGNILIPDINSNIINFDNATPGVCRIYGYAFTGTILATFGANVNEIALSDSCYALSENFLTVIRETPEGGTVSTADGATEVTVSIDGEDSSVDIVADGAAELIPYTFVVTDTNNVILAIGEGPTFDFADAGVGVCRVWGLSYQGELLATAGVGADTAQLASSCFSLSANFVTVTRTEGDGVQPSEDGIGLAVMAYPNPVSGSVLQVVIESDETLTDGQAYVLDQNGTSYAVTAVAGGTNATTVTFDISTLPTGLYTVRYVSGARQEIVRFIRH